MKVLQKFTARPGMREAYKAVLTKTYQSITSKERNDRKALKDDLDQIQTKISKARELLLSGDLKRMRIITGSIFPEKLTFNEFYYRTTRINEAVRLIYMMDKELDENKNGQSEENFELSIPVAPRGFEPRLIINTL
jgi:site-specific DNA recombinase